MFVRFPFLWNVSINCTSHHKLRKKGVKVSQGWLLLQPENVCFATSPSSQMRHFLLIMAPNMTRNRNSYLNHSAWDACLKGESAIMVARESAGAPEGHREDFVFELQNQCWVLLTRLHAPNVGIASIVRSDGMDEHEACESATPTSR